MKKISLLFVCFLIINFTYSQTENIDLIKLELYGGTVSSVSITTDGKELQLFYSEKNNQIISNNQFETYPDSIYYPIIARVRIFKKTPTIFPNNLSLRIDFEYFKKVKGINKAIQIYTSYNISNSKILGKDPNDGDKFYIDGGNTSPDELMLYNTADIYRLGYLDKSIVGKNIFIRDLKATIREGVRL